MITRAELTQWVREGLAIAGYLDDAESADLIRALHKGMAKRWETLYPDPPAPEPDTKTTKQPRLSIVQGFTTDTNGHQVPRIIKQDPPASTRKVRP